MAEIRIEGYGLGGSTFGHSYLVYVDDFGVEQVIRGGPSVEETTPWHHLPNEFFLAN